MAAALKAQRQFASFGHSYAPGDIIPPEHHASWPGDTLRNRLEGGDVAYVTLTEDEVADAAFPKEPETPPTE